MQSHPVVYPLLPLYPLLGDSWPAVLQDVFEDERDVHIVMELCEGAALTDAVSAGRLADERDVAIIVSSILRFIAQCHGKGIVYRDVKPDNFLFVRDEVTSPIKATDFGLSIRHSSGEAPLTSRSGTPAYMAPEVCTTPQPPRCRRGDAEMERCSCCIARQGGGSVTWVARRPHQERASQDRRCQLRCVMVQLSL